MNIYEIEKLNLVEIEKIALEKMYYKCGQTTYEKLSQW